MSQRQGEGGYVQRMEVIVKRKTKVGEGAHSACQESIFDQRLSDIVNSEDKVYS